MPKDPNLFNKLLDNDEIKKAISDPELMKEYIAKNPVLQQMIASDPNLEKALLDSKLMQEIVTPENIDEANKQFAKRLLSGDEKIKDGSGKLNYVPIDNKENQDEEPAISEEEEIELRSNYAFQLKQIKDAGIDDETSVLLILRDTKGDAQKSMEIINKLRQEKKNKQ